MLHSPASTGSKPDARSWEKQPVDPVAQQQAREVQEVSEAFAKGVTALRDFVAPSSLEFSGDHFQLGTRYARTFYVYGYPRQLYTGWISSIVNLDEVMIFLW